MRRQGCVRGHETGYRLCCGQTVMAWGERAWCGGTGCYGSRKL